MQAIQSNLHASGRDGGGRTVPLREEGRIDANAIKMKYSYGLKLIRVKINAQN
jgi:hypothetical protein